MVLKLKRRSLEVTGLTVKDFHLLVPPKVFNTDEPARLDGTYVITYDTCMSTLSASEARANLYRLIDEAAESHTPIRITGKRNNAVLISEADWAAVQETMYLLSIPGMRESIREGMEAPLDEFRAELDW